MTICFKKFVSFTFITILLFQTFVVFCAEIDRYEAERIARSWIAESFDVPSGIFEADLLFTEIERHEEVIAYVFEPVVGGFVLVSGDDSIYPVLAYSERNLFNPDIPAVAEFLDTVYDVIMGYEVYTEYYFPELFEYAGQKIGPLLQTQWSQGWPYNKFCPSIGDQRTWAGCVAVAMGQIMRYHSHPFRGSGRKSYYWLNGGRVIEESFRVNYDWANMPITIHANSPAVEIDAVSKLLYHAGVSLEMNYGLSASVTGSANYVPVAFALMNYFHYDYTAYFVGRGGWDERWFTMLSEEIINNRPVYYQGFGPGGGVGHAFVLDGVNHDGGMDTEFPGPYWVHLNYGWGGAADGWYNLNLFYLYTESHGAVFGIKPWIRPPRITTQRAVIVDSTSATLRGRLASSGGVEMLKYAFGWGSNSISDNDVFDVDIFEDGGFLFFKYDLTNLCPNTTYYFKARAQNEAGWGYGEVKTFTTTKTLTVNSSNPDSGVRIGVRSWTEGSKQLDGWTTFTREFLKDRVVSLNAPLAAGGNEFSHWLVDGSFHSFERNIRVGMDRSKEMTAVYREDILTVSSQNPSSGVNIAVWPPDKDGRRNGATRFTRRYPHNRIVELHAPLAAGGNEFSHWLVDGSFHSFERNIRVGMDRSKEMTAVYRP